MTVCNVQTVKFLIKLLRLKLNVKNNIKDDANNQEEQPHEKSTGIRTFGFFLSKNTFAVFSVKLMFLSTHGDENLSNAT